MKKNNPLLAITMGDPAGCGPEVIAKAIAFSDAHSHARLVCIGDSRVMHRAVELVNADLEIASVSNLDNAIFESDRLNVLDLANVDLGLLQIGKIQAHAGQVAFEYITRAIDLALKGEIDGVVTAPINKESLHLAGHKYGGHTQIFADRTKTTDVTMMLASGQFRVTHVTTHVSLRRAIGLCTFDRILRVIHLTNDGLNRMGIRTPHIAVAGLNPHSGEGGIFGKEEINIIQPAIDTALEEGLNILSYPVPPDTVFVRMLKNREFDAVVAQYHDQGHIAAKIVDFLGGVNITLGLPIIRTSVDHGTAFDIAGKGLAHSDSLVNAIKLASKMCAHSIDKNRIPSDRKS